MASVLTTLPLQIMCQLVMPRGSSFENTSTAVNISTSPIKPETLPSGYVAYPDMDAAYKLHDEIEVTWLEARKLCVSEGAQLAVIDTPKKLNFILYRRPTGKRVHVGIHSFAHQTDWVSVKDGAPVLTPQWASGEPRGGYQCVMLNAMGDGLMNSPCSFVGYYMCELPIPEA